MSITYNVYTNCNPQQLTDIALETYRKWLSFALGQSTLGGHKIKRPSGKYAASIQWKKTGISSVAIFTDEPIGDLMETGRDPFSIKEKMLAKKFRLSKQGYRYRYVPVKQPFSNKINPSEASALFSIMEKFNNPKVAKLWAYAHTKHAHPKTKRGGVKTMSDKPGSAAWIIPAFTPYMPAKILSDRLQKKYKR